MERQQVLNLIQDILDDSKTAVLATVDAKGYPDMRWMTPSVINGRAGALFSVTSPEWGKISEIKANPRVSWIIQTPCLDMVVYVKGIANIIDNPSLKAEVISQVGSRLTVFWKINSREIADFVVLETIIEEAEVFCPMHGLTEKVKFTPEDSNGK